MNPIYPHFFPFKIEETPFWGTAAQAFGVSPDRLGLFQFVTQPRMREVILAARHRAVDVLHSGSGIFPVGLTLALVDIQAAQGGESMAAEYRRDLAEVYLEQLPGDDFVGVQTFSRMLVGPQSIVHPGEDVEKNQMGEEYYPEAIGGTIRHAARVAGIPIFVT